MEGWKFLVYRECELILEIGRHTFLLETLIGLAAAAALLTAAAADSALLMITALC